MSDREQPAMLCYATERVLRPRISLYHGFLTLPGLFLITGGVWMRFENAPAYWIVFIGMGLVLYVLPLLHLIPGASFLRIGNAGFSIRQWFKSEHFRWDDIIRFEVVSGSRKRDPVLVGVTCRTDPKHRGLSRHQRRQLAHRSIPRPQYIIIAEDYGMTAEGLVSLLEQYRRQSIGIK